MDSKIKTILGVFVLMLVMYGLSIIVVSNKRENERKELDEGGYTHILYIEGHMKQPIKDVEFDGNCISYINRKGAAKTTCGNFSFEKR